MECGKKKSWLMMLGCLLPIIALIALPLFGITGPWLPWLAFLACPLAMWAMIHMHNEKAR